mmetsp:Transcript_54515/g.95248  ORF Transcript_54515/g.95248 Transcript_54515/m.95248 type:complete len:242 (-) Transcript_54515:3214-3939(-)
MIRQESTEQLQGHLATGSGVHHRRHLLQRRGVRASLGILALAALAAFTGNRVHRHSDVVGVLGVGRSMARHNTGHFGLGHTHHGTLNHLAGEGLHTRRKAQVYQQCIVFRDDRHTYFPQGNRVKVHIAHSEATALDHNLVIAHHTADAGTDITNFKASFDGGQLRQRVIAAGETISRDVYFDFNHTVRAKVAGAAEHTGNGLLVMVMHEIVGGQTDIAAFLSGDRHGGCVWGDDEVDTRDG